MRSLQEAYNNVRTNNISSKYKSLNDVYLGEATVSFQFEKEKPQVFSLKDVYAKEIMKRASGHAYNIEGLIKEWVKSGNWTGKTASSFLPQKIFEILNSSFPLEEQNIAQKVSLAIQTIIEEKNSVSFFEDSLNSEKESFLDFFNSSISSHPSKAIFNNPQLINKFINLLEFKENNVVVGRGEVFITLFSEASNRGKGDVALKDGSEVEIKGDFGRVGKNAASRATSTMTNMVKSLEKYYNSRKKELENEFNTLSGTWVPIIEKMIKETNPSPSKLTVLKSIKHYLTKEISSHKDLSSSNNINLTPSRLSMIDQESVKLIDIVKEYNNLKVEGFSSNFSSYFNILIENKDLQNLVDSISSFSSHNVSQEEKSQLAQIIRTDILTNPNPLRLIEVLVTAIQAADYALEEDFKFILLFNTKNKHQIVLKNTNDFINNVKNFYKHKNDVKISVGTGGSGSTGAGGGRSGFQILVL